MKLSMGDVIVNKEEKEEKLTIAKVVEYTTGDGIVGVVSDDNSRSYKSIKEVSKEYVLDNTYVHDQLNKKLLKNGGKKNG